MKPILQVIIFATAMLVSSLHGAVLENTGKCAVSFYLVHTTIPNYNSVTRILAPILGWNFNSFYEVNQKFKCFLFCCCCCFSLYRAIQIGNQAPGQNRVRMGAYLVKQTFYLRHGHLGSKVRIEWLRANARASNFTQAHYASGCCAMSSEPYFNTKIASTWIEWCFIYHCI